jgi:biopolymer transport protein TolR
MKLRRGRRIRRGRIEIIPMIDVMFFLLATFMLASLALQNLHALAVDLPKGHAVPLQAGKPATLTVTRDGALRVGGGIVQGAADDEAAVTIETLAAALKPRLAGSDAKIVVNADVAAPNGVVVQAMLRAREAGAGHFLIAVKRE